MPNDAFDTIATSTLQRYSSTLEDNVFSCRPFMFWLAPKRKSITGGRSIVKPVMSGENTTVASYTGYDTLPCVPQKGITAAEYVCSQYVVSISICGKEELINKGKAEVFDLLEAKTVQAEESLIERLDHDLINNGTSADELGRTSDGNDGKDVIGLEGIINWKANPYLGGIDSSRDDCAFWRSFIDSAGYWEAVEAAEDPAVTAPPIPLSLKDLGNLYDTVSCGNDTPDLFLTSKGLYQSYRALAEAVGTLSFNQNMVDLGFQNLMYMGATVMWDEYVPDDTVYAVNTKYLDLTYWSDRWFSVDGFRKMPHQDSRCAYIFMAMQLCTNQRRRHGMLCNRRPNC